MRFGVLLSVCVAMVAAPVAVAQQPTGVVTILKTPAGSVLVERGSEIYQLREGDVLFAGDRIFTRTNGALRFTFADCDVGLGGQQTILVDASSVCTAPPVNLASSDVVGGIAVGTGGEIATTPTILLSLLTAGGLAAGAAAGGSNEFAPTAASP